MCTVPCGRRLDPDLHRLGQSTASRRSPKGQIYWLKRSSPCILPPWSGLILRIGIGLKCRDPNMCDIRGLFQASMTDSIFPQPSTAGATSESLSEPLRRLTKFSQDIGQMTDIAAIAERILTSLSEVARCREGSLYLAEQGRSDFCRQATHGSAQAKLMPPRLRLTQPQAYQLAQHHEVQDQFARARADSQATRETVRSLLESLPCSIAIPLVNRGRLVGLVLLQSEPVSAPSDPESIDLLTAMAQAAANLLDSLLAHEDLRRSQRLMCRTDRLRSLETIAGGVAHEIRNPLTSIKTFIQLTPERKDDAEFIQEFSQMVLDDVQRMERLIQDILDYARYMEPKLTEEDLNSVVLSCLSFIEVKARSREIKIEKELAPELPRVMLDRQQIKQVLLNLFLNAMDAMGERGGTLWVRTSMFTKPEGNVWVQIEVEDTGHGISPANLDHIFDPFFTTKHESKDNEGTGLGLSIAHQIIREHQGNIHVRSTEGVGATFRLCLPSIA